MNRRTLLKMAIGGAVFTAAASILNGRNLFAAQESSLMAAAITSPIEKITKTNDEWQKILTPQQYNVLREEGTERPYTSDLLKEKRAGVFKCAGCDLPLFESKTKFESGTGWPSFFDHIKGHLGTKTDSSLMETRIEYHCARCGGHHGHVFNDGPQPTGLRYCNNGVALIFETNGA
jgi:peptide-methionine (R)-S-oxide reductase